MKRTVYLIIALVLSIVFTSCNNLKIQKKKYSRGYSIHRMHDYSVALTDNESIEICENRTYYSLDLIHNTDENLMESNYDELCETTLLQKEEIKTLHKITDSEEKTIVADTIITSEETNLQEQINKAIQNRKTGLILMYCGILFCPILIFGTILHIRANKKIRGFLTDPKYKLTEDQRKKLEQIENKNKKNKKLFYRVILPIIIVIAAFFINIAIQLS